MRFPAAALLVLLAASAHAFPDRPITVVLPYAPGSAADAYARALGDHMARTFTGTNDLRVELGFYRVLGVDPASSQSWRSYLTGVLAFSAVSVLLVYLLQRTQALLPYSLGLPAVPEGLGFNTAVSFVTNTNWQWYSGETTAGHLLQASGLTVQNFVSAGTGMAVAAALARSLARPGAVVLRAGLALLGCEGADGSHAARRPPRLERRGPTSADREG